MTRAQTARNKKGGIARAKKLSPQVRREIAIKAVRARWQRAKPVSQTDKCSKCGRFRFKHTGNKDSLCGEFQS